MRTLIRSGLVAVIALCAGVRPAAAGFVGRSLTLGNSRAELDLGAGLGRVPDELGIGFNLELGYGLTSELDLRVRTGLRVGYDGRATDADIYGRPFETETYNPGGDTLANPEIGLLWSLTHGHTAQIGFDARVMLPVGSNISFLVGLPIRLHFARARLDTGVFVPIFFHDHDGDRKTNAIFSVPLHLWFQTSGGLYLGPVTGVRFHDGGSDVPLGLGIGAPLSGDADLRFWLLFPDVSHSGSAKTFGAGVAISVMF
jgi:hypothetical protein